MGRSSSACPRSRSFLPAQAVQRLNAEIAAEITGVRQRFEGRFSGDAMLLFPESASLELVRCLLDDEVELNTMSEMEHEALCEVGNVILNAVVSALADELNVDLETGLPKLVEESIEDLLPSPIEEKILFLRVDFTFPPKGSDETAASSVKGYVVFVMEVKDFHHIGKELTCYLDRLEECA